MVFDSKHDFPPPAIFLGILLCPWMRGTASKLLQGCAASAPAPTILLGLLCPWTWGISSKRIHKTNSFFIFIVYLYYKYKITIYIYNSFTHSHSKTLVWIGAKVDRKRMVYGLFQCSQKAAPVLPDGSVVKNPPANAEDTGLIPYPGRSYMLCTTIEPVL